MSASGPKRAERLLNLLQIFYQHRYPISGHRLAEELSISLRTLYRDIGALRAQGADIQGEAGTGYIAGDVYPRTARCTGARFTLGSHIW
jgi:predicted DNA-binding transcriptional regulator YafY